MNNNFHLIRLFAAFTVLLFHLLTHHHAPGLSAGLGESWLAELTRNFYRALPGVPIFFIVSGFLITNSWLKKSSLSRFFNARMRRILPAYMACIPFTVVMLWVAGFWQTLSIGEAAQWVLAQASIFGHHYTPSVLAGFAGESVNGSLWTIPVELTFYALVPLMLWQRRSLPILITGLLSAAFFLKNGDAYHETLLPHFWWFAMGMLACLHWEKVSHWVTGKALLWFILHAGVFFLLPHSHLLSDTATDLVLGLTLAPLVLSCAYTLPSLSGKVLGTQDISYGLYLYHQPIFHMMVALGFVGLTASLSAIAAAVAVAIISWVYIEKPSSQTPSR